jgi:hypothetical protein
MALEDKFGYREVPRHLLGDAAQGPVDGVSAHENSANSQPVVSADETPNPPPYDNDSLHDMDHEREQEIDSGGNSGPEGGDDDEQTLEDQLYLELESEEPK